MSLRILSVFFVLWIALCSAVQAAAPGSLDTTFNLTGIVTTTIDPAQPYEEGRSVIQQKDGKLVVAGEVKNVSGGVSDFALTRYDNAGALDTAFDTDGKVTTDFGAGYQGANAVIQQTDGKLVAAGVNFNSATADMSFLIMRYNSDGSLDTGFDGDGKLTTKFNGTGNNEANSVIQQSDDKLVVAGRSGSVADHVAIARYNVDGSLDSAFGVAGKVTTDFGGSYDTARQIISQVDGKLVITGSGNLGNGLEVIVARYNHDGSLDATFSGDGKTNTSVGMGAWAYSIIQQPDGKLVVAGYINNDSADAWYEDVFLVRYNSSGSIDSTFGVNGIVTTHVPFNRTRGYSLIQQNDGKLVVAGYITDGNGFRSALFRYNADGSLDAAFGSNGILITDVALGYGGEQFNSVIQQSDGKLAAAGTASADGDFTRNFTLARYESGAPLKIILGGESKDNTGNSVAFAGDFNGDGYGDYVIGIPGYDLKDGAGKIIQKDAGRAVVISGKSGLSLAEVFGAVAKDALGSSVAGDGDINNDGFDDVVVGAPKADNFTDPAKKLADAGSVTVLYGRANVDPVVVPNQTFFGEQAKSLSGSAIALGDVDDDSFADIIVGAPKADDLTDPAKKLVDAGSVTVIDGDTLVTLPDVYYGSVAKAYAGTAVATGKFDAVAGDDIIIGAPNDDDVVNKLADAGSATVYSIANATTPVMKKYGAVSKAYLGKSVAAGNVDGVTGDEVLAGAPGDDNGSLKDTGSVTVFFADATPSVTKYGAVAKAILGNSVAAGDVNADGYADIIAGAWKDDKPGVPKVIKDTGSVSIWSGNGYAQIGSTLYGTASKDYFGTAVSAGDINSDGEADLIIGIPGFDVPAEKLIKDAGAVRVLSGAGL